MIGDHNAFAAHRQGAMQMTQGELAEALGVGLRTVQRWESGTQDIPIMAWYACWYLRDTGHMHQSGP